MVTTTFTVPAARAGITAVIVAALTTATAVAGMPPSATVAPAAKFVPVNVTDVPPAVLPVFGLIAVNVGDTGVGVGVGAGVGVGVELGEVGLPPHATVIKRSSVQDRQEAVPDE